MSDEVKCEVCGGVKSEVPHEMRYDKNVLTWICWPCWRSARAMEADANAKQ